MAGPYTPSEELVERCAEAIDGIASGYRRAKIAECVLTEALSSNHLFTREQVEEALPAALRAVADWLPDTHPGDESQVTEEDYRQAFDHGSKTFYSRLAPEKP